MEQLTPAKKLRVVILWPNKPLLSFLFLVQLFGCTPVDSSDSQVTVDSSLSCPTTFLKVEELSEEMETTWYAHFNSWQREQFGQLLDGMGFIQTCEDCESIWLTLQFSVTPNGKVASPKIIKRNVYCAGKSAEELQQFELRLIQSLDQKAFPEQMRGQAFELNWGRGLTC